jgi:hypothetical protein
LSIITDLLQQLGLLRANAPTQRPPSSEAVLLRPDPRPAVVEGAVSTTSGDLDRAASPRPRAVAFLGPETTLRGLGVTVHDWLQTIVAPTVPVLDALSVTHALMAYHRDDLALADLTTVTPAPLLPFPAWEVGRGVRLPIEIDASNRPVTDLSHWADLASSADPAWDAVLDWTPWPLAIPDHDADTQWATDEIAAATTLSDTADDLREMVLANPSKSLYRLLAFTAATKAAGPAQQEQLWSMLLVTACSPDELALLATTYPGAAALRAWYRRLADLAALPGHAPTVDQAVQVLNGALGLPAGSTPVSLMQNTPSAVPRELPVSPAWSRRPDATKHVTYDTNGERIDGRHDLVLGRAFYAGRWQDDGRYNGPAYAGNSEYSVATYVAAHQADVFAGADATTKARLDIVAAIAANEGFLDAVRLRDRGILSLGVQQWTVHVDNELNVLLYNLERAHPDDYDTHVGVYGLRLSQTDTWTGTPPGMPAGAAKAVTLAQAGSGTQITPMPAPQPAPDHPADRLHFFGGAADPAKPGYFRFDDSPWGGRVRSATRCSRAVQFAELSTAAGRFGRIRAEGRTWSVAGTEFTIDQLVTSAQGAAQVLDQHINSPGHLATDVQTAIAKVTVTPATDPQGNLSTAWLTAFETAYLQAVRYGAGITKIDIPLPNGKVLRGRQSYILKQNLSAASHSFGGW